MRSLGTGWGGGPWVAPILAIGLACLVLVPPSHAQVADKGPRVGLLTSGQGYGLGSVDRLSPWLGLLGYREGENIVYVRRMAAGQDERLPALAAELVRLPVDLIVTEGVLGARAARQATSRIPIVVVVGGDPVKAGLVASLARPGGNLTGLLVPAGELAATRLELLKLAVPGLKRVGILWNPAHPELVEQFKEVEGAARMLGVEPVSLEARAQGDLAPRIQAAAAAGVNGLLVLLDRVTFANALELANLATQSRLPAIYPSRVFVEAFRHDGLMSYEVSQVEVSQRLAAYVDRILRGARPAELPIERPSTFDLVINLRAARAIGLEIPAALHVGATKVIE